MVREVRAPSWALPCLRVFQHAVRGPAPGTSRAFGPAPLALPRGRPLDGQCVGHWRSTAALLVPLRVGTPPSSTAARVGAPAAPLAPFPGCDVLFLPLRPRKFHTHTRPFFSVPRGGPAGAVPGYGYPHSAAPWPHCVGYTVCMSLGVKLEKRLESSKGLVPTRLCSDPHA